jgi:hypothetical protein
MAVKAPPRRTRRIPLVLFFVYGMFALLIAGVLLAIAAPAGSPIYVKFHPVPTATSVPSPTVTEATATLVPTAVGTGVPTVIAQLTPTSVPVTALPPPPPSQATSDNPFGLPLWVLQVLFGFTAISGVASMVRWVAGAIGTLARLFRR